MCGITGFWATSSNNSHVGNLSAMTDSIAHRGPDADGHWFDENQNLFLGHRRLSILDLSESGDQPMGSHCGRYQIVYNGEIYNHLEIREELNKSFGDIGWRGHSDTETIVTAIAAFGFEQAIEKLNGMFAIALWDREEKSLTLARDRMGEKPLYYGSLNGAFVFGSELRSLRAFPTWHGTLNDASVNAFIHYSSVPAPLTIYKNIYKLPAANWVKITDPQQCIPDSTRYWDLSPQSANNFTNDVSEAELINTLESKLIKAVKSRTLSDVPLGAFLSGGIDSSLITALLQECSNTPVQTFTIGFGEEQYNEAPFAKEIAAHLGTNHTEMLVSEKEALNVIPDLPTFFDEPFADVSQIPTLFISKLARQKVTVALSGDGGDELFYGYSRYAKSIEIWNRINSMPSIARQLFRGSVPKLIPPLVHGANFFKFIKNTPLHSQILRLELLSKSLSAHDFAALYEQMITTARQNICLSERHSTVTPYVYTQNSQLDQENFMMYADMNHYLPETVLTKVDRATMRYSLESRAPLLDHDLVEFAWQIPQSMKYRDGTSKWALQEVLGRYVPKTLFDRPKMGFGVPIDSWLRGELKPWASDLLSAQSIKRHGLLDEKQVQRIFDDHTSNRVDNQYALWNILMLQSWLDQEKSAHATE